MFNSMINNWLSSDTGAKLTENKGQQQMQKQNTVLSNDYSKLSH